MDEYEDLKDALKAYKEERISQLEKALVKSAEIIDKDESIDVPNSLSDEGVYMESDGGRCAIVSYKKHYFLYDKSAKKFFAPHLTYKEVEKDYFDVEEDKG